jgi:hypothetical protein
MAATPPPEGMTEEDYDAIHAAVLETVRGRWFLTEYARRNRVEEVQEMLTAIGRLETVVTSQRAMPLPGDAAPHLRLLTQRADEIAKRLGDLIEDLRDSGADGYLCDELETQARAIAGLQKSLASDSVPAIAPTPRALPAEARPALEAPMEPPKEWPVAPTAEAARPAEPPRMPSLPRAEPWPVRGDHDSRLAALAALDRLSMAEKLALFS